MSPHDRERYTVLIPEHTYHILSDDTQRACVPTKVGNSDNLFGTVVGVNTHKGWDVVFDFFSQDNRILKHLYHNNLSVVKPNEEEKEYDNVPYTTTQVVGGMLYETSDETEYREEGKKNDLKDGDGSMKNK